MGNYNLQCFIGALTINLKYLVFMVELVNRFALGLFHHKCAKHGTHRADIKQIIHQEIMVAWEVTRCHL